MNNTKNSEAVEKALGEPFGLEYTEDVLKTRRNLLIAGSVGILFWYAGLQIDTAQTNQAVSFVFGMNIKGITHKTFLCGLLIATSYLLLHFLWASVDALKEFGLRSTGSRVAHQTGAKVGSEEKDYPSDPRQSTLYHWWLEKGRGMSKLPALFEQAQGQIAAEINVLQELAKHNDPAGRNLAEAIRLANATNVQLSQLATKVQDLQKVLVSERIPVSLKRFDEAFKFHSMSQNARWLVLEFGFPVVVGISGIVLTVLLVWQA